jgi:methylated-DNA-[protein]-cysteine S-methyltransferase
MTKTQKRYVYKVTSSPVGRLTLVASDDGLAGILWPTERPGRVRLPQATEDRRHPVLLQAERQLKEYFAGRRRAFALTLDVAGTAFQRKVERSSPFRSARVRTQIARQIGRPTAARASARPTGGTRCRSSPRVTASSARHAHGVCGGLAARLWAPGSALGH